MYSYYAFKKLYDEHRGRLADFAIINQSKRVAGEDNTDYRINMVENFKRRAAGICSNMMETCNIVLDVCYKKNSTKQLAWDIVSAAILINLCKRANGVMAYPIPDPDGDFEFRGQKYSMAKAVVDLERDYFRRV